MSWLSINKFAVIVEYLLPSQIVLDNLQPLFRLCKTQSATNS